jgi:hypothetical protein
MEEGGSAIKRESVSARALGVESRKIIARSCSHEGLRATLLHHDSILIENAPNPGNNAATSVGMRLERLDLGNGVDRVAKDNRTEESPFQNRQKRHGIDPRCLADKSRGDRHAEQSVRDGPAEWAALTEGMVDMQRIEVSRQPGENDDIRFRDSPSRAFPFLADHKFVERSD